MPERHSLCWRALRCKEPRPTHPPPTFHPIPAPTHAGPTLLHLGRASEGGVLRAAPLDDVAQQRLLAVVGGEDGDLVCGVAQQAHVLVDAYQVLSLAQVLQAGEGVAGGGAGEWVSGGWAGGQVRVCKKGHCTPSEGRRRTWRQVL